MADTEEETDEGLTLIFSSYYYSLFSNVLLALHRNSMHHYTAAVLTFCCLSGR